MSIEDLRSVADTTIDADICLVGSGPAGWTIAEELRGTGLRLLMLESGGHRADPDAAALNEVEDVGIPVFNGRSRILGGTSQQWNGRCIPFDDIDYEARPWMPLSGWPFGAKALASDVDRASEYLNAGPYYQQGERRAVPRALQLQPKVDPSVIRPVWWEIPAQIDFGRILAARRSANLRVLVRATVTHLDTDAGGRQIRSVEVADANGRRVTVHARAVILCAGGIENPRILLYSNRANPDGLGNAHDAVGRYLMDHPRDFGLIARVDLADADRFRDLFGPCRLDSARGRHDFSYGFALSPERQRAEGLLNAAAWPYEVTSDTDPLQAARRLAKGPRNRVLRDLANVARQPGLLLRGLHSRFVTHQNVRHQAERIGFLVSSEQMPDWNSRVWLGSRKDALGLPMVKVDWRVGEVEARSQAVLAQSIAAEFARLGLPQVHVAEWARTGRYGDARFADGCHPSGTTRMAADPRQGVVDADCQVHGVDSLYIAGSSVFPTGSHANPTLMIMALAVRLSRHLKQRFSATQPASRPMVSASTAEAVPVH